MSSEKYSLSCLTGRYLEALCSFHSYGKKQGRENQSSLAHIRLPFQLPTLTHRTCHSSFNLETFIEKAVCSEVGKCTILPDSKCILKADGLEGPLGWLTGRVWPLDKGRGLRKGIG